MGLALLRRERGCGERVYTTEILVELSQRAARCSVNPKPFGDPAGLLDCREAVSLLYRLSHCYSWLSKDLTLVDSYPLFFSPKIRKGFIKPQVPLLRRRSRHLSFFPTCDLLKKS